MEGIFTARPKISAGTLFLVLLSGIGYLAFSLHLDVLHSPWLNGIASTSGWYPIVHTKTNAFLVWHDGLLSILNFPFSQHAQILIAAITFVAGFTFLLQIVYQDFSCSQGLTLSSTLLLAYLFLLGFDFVTLAIVSTTPLLMFLIFRALTELEAEQRYKALAILAAVANCAISYCYSSLGIALALILALCLKKQLKPLFPLIRDSRDIYFLLLICIPSVLIGLLAPLPDFPSYSPLGHVVPDDGLPGNILPLFAPMPPIPLIDRGILKEALSAPTALLLLFSGLLYAIRRTPLSALAILLSACLAADVLAPEWLSQIAPLAVLQRIVPFWFFFPIQLPLICTALLLTVLNAGRSHLLFAIMLTLILAFSPQLSENHTVLPKPGATFTSSDTPLLREIQAFSAEPEFSDYVHRVIASPSYATLNKTGLWPLFIRDIIQHWRFSSLLREQPVVSTHAPGIEPIEFLFDRNIGTRWSPGGGRQQGNEWVYIYLPSPQLVHGFELVSGPFHTDFGRGLRLSAGEQCPEKITSLTDVSLSKVASFPHWEGSLTVTSGGYPYFGGQGGGRIYLKEPTRVRCFLIEQTGKVNGFDWSIAEIRTLRYPQ